ncbi:MAG TPA: HAD family hydrolase [Pyrinomonadaceae bacterium]|nr:HAD family hydrolase [Pyrinomonadaceae bacterium]
MTSNNKAVFVDRDGTLIEEVNFLSDVKDLRLFPYTVEAVRLLKDHGFRVVVVTNQSGIGRGIYDEAAMHSIHAAIQEELTNAIDAFYFCPHLPHSGCRCRKPGLKMIEDACQDLDIDLTDSWMVGDKRLDVETGYNAGIKTSLVLTGYGKTHVDMLERFPDIIAANLLDAAKRIVAARRRPSTI